MMRSCSAAALTCVLAASASAQRAPAELVPTGALPMTHLLCELPAYHDDASHLPAGHQRVPVQRSGAGPSATFQITYNGFTPAAQAAFQAAADIWATHIASAVPIKVQANWTPLGAGVLGSAGSNGIFANFAGAPLPGTWFGNALADATSGTDMGTGFDIVSNFSSNFANWYLGTDGNTPAGQFDLMGIVLHELGHGLGFFGRGTVDDGNPSTGQGTECNGTAGFGCWGAVGLPVIYERYVQNQAGDAMIDPANYANPSPELGTLLRSNQLYFDGPTLTATLGTRGRLFAPGAFNYGSSFSHFNESSYPAGSPNALMTPFISPGESFAGPGPATCALFKDLGWPLGPDCLGLIVNPSTEHTADVSEAALELTGPNPFTARTALRLGVREAGAVRAELVDVTGRVVATLFDGVAAPGVPVELAVDGSALAPGVYVVRATGTGFAATRRLVVAR